MGDRIDKQLGDMSRELILFMVIIVIISVIFYYIKYILIAAGVILAIVGIIKLIKYLRERYIWKKNDWL